MPQTRQNKITVPVNADAYNLTGDLATLADSTNVAVRVSSTSERDALTKSTGLQVQRLDLAGLPRETWDGSAWQGITWVPYTPSWNGFSNLGTGAVSTGSYMLIGKLCFVRMKLVAGSGASAGTGSLAVTLPFTSALGQSTSGDGQWLPTGVSGGLQRIMLSNPENNNQAAIFANPSGTAVAQSPGAAGFSYVSNTEVHATITYQVA